MRGKRLSSEEAFQLGIACEVVEKSELENMTKIVKELGIPLAQRTIKSVKCDTNATLHTSIDLEENMEDLEVQMILKKG